MLKLLIFWCTRRSGTGAHSDQSLLHINIGLPAARYGTSGPSPRPRRAASMAPTVMSSSP